MSQHADDYDDHPRPRRHGWILMLLLVAAAFLIAVPIGLVILFILALGMSNM
jgi:hypothetical protein